MKKLFNKRFGFLLLLGVIIILGISMILIAGPPDEAPPFWSPGP